MKNIQLVSFNFAADLRKEMMQLNLPDYLPAVRSEAGKNYILDRLRKKYVALTPEEWVRQHFVNYLITCKNYPQGRTGNEISLTLNGMKKRCDTVVYGKTGNPVMIAEYKAPEIPVNQAVFDQISLYNLAMQVPYLVVSNGINHYCCQMNYENKTYRFLEDIPNYNEL